MHRTWTFGCLVVAGSLLSGCTEANAPSPAAAKTELGSSSASAPASVVLDPIGDASYRQNTGPGSEKKVPGWLDITRAEISRQSRTFVMTMDLATALPAAPPEASGGFGVYQWGWALDTDAGTSPSGTPFPGSDANAFEFFVLLDWDGTAFQATVMDRRPLLSGGEAVLTPIDFGVSGATVRVSVPQSLLSNPSAFSWAAFTDIRHSHYGTEGFDLLDGAPDATLATWPG